MAQNKIKPPNSPLGAKMWCTGEADGLGNVAGMLTICTDVQSIRTTRKWLRTQAKTVERYQWRPREHNLHVGCKIATAKMETCRVERAVTYEPQNTPFEDLDTRVLGRGIEVLLHTEDEIKYTQRAYVEVDLFYYSLLVMIAEGMRPRSWSVAVNNVFVNRLLHPTAAGYLAR